MKPIDPGADFGELREVAKDQDEYKTLIARIGMAPEGITLTTRWQFSDEERAAIAAGGDLLLSVLTFGKPLQPLGLSIAGVETAAEAMTYVEQRESPVSESMAFPSDVRSAKYADDAKYWALSDAEYASLNRPDRNAQP